MIYLDIETLQQDPYEWAIKPDNEIKAPKTYKDPEKIAAYLAEAAANQVAELRTRSSLDPLLGGIVVCVGIAVRDADPVVLLNESSDEAGEGALLRKVQAGLLRPGNNELPLVSWNGTFDWRWLAIRALRHGLYDLARRARPAKPWGDRMHIDPLEAWRLGSRDCLAGLANVARYLGIEVTDSIDGSRVAEVWHADRQVVVDHCRADVVRLRAVTAHLAAAGLLQLEEDTAAPALPPLRGSAADLAGRAWRRMTPETAAEVWATVSPDPMPTTLAGLTNQPVAVLAAYYVALGGRV